MKTYRIIYADKYGDEVVAIVNAVTADEAMQVAQARPLYRHLIRWDVLPNLLAITK